MLLMKIYQLFYEEPGELATLNVSTKPGDLAMQGSFNSTKNININLFIYLFF